MAYSTLRSDHICFDF